MLQGKWYISRNFAYDQSSLYSRAYKIKTACPQV